MTMQTSGPISISQVATELATAPGGLMLSNTSVRNLANDLSGPVRMSDLYGKSSNTPGINYLGSITATIVAGANTTSLASGTSYGYSEAVFGSISNTLTSNGYTIQGIIDSPVQGYIAVYATDPTNLLTLPSLRTFTINGFSTTSTGATYFGGGRAAWRFPTSGQTIIANGGTYQFSIT